mmetsp:Transcript_62384/g.52905  ORF Transcript_62384/g.52905 Transcript_62384/m.52905 type:complete len:109 (+) Transcript_62384:2-328(+)
MMPDEEVTRDVRYVLDDPEMLGIIFQVFSECQSLHPDDELDGEGDFMFNEEEVSNGAVCMMNVTDIAMVQNGIVNAQDQAALDRWDELLTETDNAGDSRFDDVDNQEP